MNAIARRSGARRRVRSSALDRRRACPRPSPRRGRRRRDAPGRRAAGDSTSTSRWSRRPATAGRPLASISSGSATTRRVRAVHRAERVVDVRVGELGEPLRRTRGSFASSPGSNRRFSSRTIVAGSTRAPGTTLDLGPDDAVGRRRTRPPVSELGEPLGDRRRAAASRRRDRFGRPRCEASDDRARRARAARSSVGRLARMRASSVTRAVLERDVEVDADEDARPGDVAEVVERARGGTGAYSDRATRLDEVDEAVRVAPLVVVPADDLDEVAHRHRRARRRTCTRPASSDDVARRRSGPPCRRACPPERPVSDAARYAALISVDGRVALSDRDEVGDRAVGHRDAHRDAVELALQLRQHQAGGLRRAGRRRDDVDRRRARPAQVLVRQVQQRLVVRVRVDRSS